MISDTKFREKLKLCRNFSGAPVDFWSQYTNLLAEASASEKVCILLEGENGKWNAVAAYPSEQNRLQIPVALGGEAFDSWKNEAVREGFAIRNTDPVRQGTALLLALDSGSKETGLALLHDPIRNVDEFAAQVPLLQTLSDIPSSYMRNRQLQQALDDVKYCVQTLDTLNIVNSQNRFYAMAMALCNEVKDRFGCSRVSLGYYKEPYIRIQAISNMDRFEPKMEIVQQLEAAMEEAADQDEDILYPPPDLSTSIIREHQRYAEAEGSKFLLTMPLRLGDRCIGAICFERMEKTFAEQDIRSMRVLCDQITRRIHDLRESDRWLGARVARGLRNWFGGYLGYTHTWRKVFAIGGALLLLSLIFIRVEYRVEAPCILRSSELIHLPAPYAGYIDEVSVKIGDLVEKDQILLRLDTSELLVERANRIAEIQRFSSQAESAEAEKRLADLRIANAQRRQSEAALALIDFQLERATLKAPFDGVIVGGDLEERLGAPVEKGENLFRLSRLQDLYVEMKVNERDLADIQNSDSGQFALASKPDERFSFTIETIEPVAVAQAQGSVFHVRGAIEHATEPWWRPGMSGVGKINTEKRSLLWIFTHRLVDFLRLHLWW